MKKESFQEYLLEINSLRSDDLELQAGLEVDYIPNKIGPKDFPGLDFTIGSIHFVDGFEDGTGWEVDVSHAIFLDGISKIFNNKSKDAIVRYYELTREMCEKSCPTIIGHLDKIKIQNIDHKFFNESDQWYRMEVIKTLDVIKMAGAITEVNTRGVYQKKTETTYPSPWIIAECHKRNIPITISSDAHHPNDLINLFPETANLLLSIGYKEISVLSDGRWQSLPFNEDGIKK